MRKPMKQKIRNLKPRQVEKVLVFAEHGLVELTHKELGTLYWLSRGEKDKLIARAMGVSERTVEGRISKIKKKLHCHSRAELAVTSYKYQLGGSGNHA